MQENHGKIHFLSDNENWDEKMIGPTNRESYRDISQSVNMDLFTLSYSPYNLYVWHLLKFVLAQMVFCAPTVLIDFLRPDI